MRIVRALVAFACLALFPYVGHAGAQYSYDALGRVTQVINVDGSTTQYTYDADGNITAVIRGNSSTLSIASFSPVSTYIGGSLVISGTGFSTTPAADVVTVGGAGATVTSATAMSLAVTVPAGAVSGPLTVTVGGVTATSAQSVIVLKPTISGFSPGVVNPGSPVLVSGQNFALTPGAVITVGGVTVTPTTLTDTTAIFNAPAATGAGQIQISTPYGQASSASDLIIAPAAIGAGNVVSYATLVSGATGSLNVSQAGKYGAFAIQGAAGQLLSLQVSSLATVPANTAVAYTVYSPTNTVLATGTVSSVSMSVHIPQIPATGSYLVAFSSSSATVQLTANLEVNPVLNAASASLSSTTAGQSKRFAFAAVAGQSESIGLNGLVLNPTSPNTARWWVYNPDGSLYTSGNCTVSTAGCEYALLGLAQTGAYTMVVAGGATTSQTVQFTASAAPDVQGQLTASTSLPVSTSIPGQSALLSFTLTSTQNVAINVSSIATVPAGATVNVNVYNAANTAAASTTGTTGATLNLQNLAAGTYRVRLTPATPVTFSSQVQYQISAGGPVSTNGTPLGISTTLPGQSAYFTFSASAGQSISLATINLALSAGTYDYVDVRLYRPNGTFYWDWNCHTSGSGCEVAIYSLDATGTWTVVINTAVANSQTMSLSFAVPASSSAPLSLGTAASVNTSPAGQATILSFTTTSVQNLVLNFSSPSTVPANVPVNYALYNSSGTLVTSGSTAGSTLNWQNFTAGTFYLHISPAIPATVSMQVTLQAGVGGAVTTNGTPSTISTPFAGQSGYFTFAANSGQSLSLVTTNLTLSAGTYDYVDVRLYRPNGSFYWDWYCHKTGSGCEVAINALDATGTWTVVINTALANTQTMSLSFAVAPTATMSMTVGTPATVSSSMTGQATFASFTTTSTQNLALNFGSLTTTPSGVSLNYTLYNSSGGTVTNGSTSGGTTLNLQNIAAGTYNLFIAPAIPATYSVPVTVLPGAGGPVTTDGTSSSVSTTLPGQSAYFTFAANSGQSLSLVTTNLALSAGTYDYVDVRLYRPNGSSYWDWYCHKTGSGCEVAISALDATGTWTVVINTALANTQTMSLSFAVAPTATMSMTVGTPATVSSSMTGQATFASFTTTSAQPLALNFASLSTVPAGVGLNYTLYNSSGGTVTSGATSGGTTLNLQNVAAGTYNLFVAPAIPATYSVPVAVEPGAGGALNTSGTPIAINTVVPGQSAYFTFSATTGQSISLATSNLVLSAGTYDYLDVRLYRPNGGSYWDWYCHVTGSGCEVPIYSLDATGTWTVVINTAQANTQTASYSFATPASASGTLVQGTPTAVNLSVTGQAEVLSFTTTTTQSVALQLSSIVTTPAGAGISYAVYNPSNTLMTSGSTVTGTTINLTNIAAGTYHLHVAPATPAAIALQVSY